jgi:hypothetical protein
VAFDLSRILQVVRTNHHLDELVAELEEVRAVLVLHLTGQQARRLSTPTTHAMKHRE